MVSKGRVTAPALATLALAASLVVTGCASHSGTGISTAGPVSGLAGRTVELTGATLVSDGDAPRLLLSGSAPLTPTVFSRDDGKRVIVDLSDTVVAAGLEPPRPARGTTSVISKVTMSSFSELGKPHVQFELVGSGPFIPKVEAGVNASGALAVVFERKVQPAFEPSVSAPPPTVPSETESVKTASLSPTAPDVAVPEKQNFVTQAATGHAASRLQAVSARKSGSGLVVQLAGNGEFGYEAFLLANPPRWVVDLPGVRNGAVPKAQEIRGGPVTRVRVSQFRNEPAAVTRVVFDLAEGVVPELRQTRTGLTVAFRAVGTVPRAQVAATPPLPRPVDTPSKPDVIAASRPVPSAVPAAGSYEAHEVEDQAEKVVPVAATTPPEAALVAAKTAPARVAPEVLQASAEVKPPAPPRKARSSSADRALVEAAEALLLQQDGNGPTRDLGNPYDARVMGSTEKQYTGEPITLNLKDADVKDTLQKFSELTGLNIVLDPEVRGTVTVSLTDIPWDQALELILKINGLGYTLEGNVMRIA
ncbi:MAG TPA: AMIN domain-containing protein, partial [Thermoanaerobaculia bacterium]